MTNKVFSPIRGKFLVLHFMPETQEFDANKIELTYLEGLFPGRHREEQTCVSE